MKWIRYPIRGEVLFQYPDNPTHDVDAEMDWLIGKYADLIEDDLSNGENVLHPFDGAQVTMTIDNFEIVDIPGRFVGSVPCKEDS